MKVCNREEFLLIPFGCVYCRNNQFEIKISNIHDSWEYISLDSINESYHNLQISDISTDNRQDEDDVFVVYEKEDLIKLKELIHFSLDGYKDNA